MRKPTSFQRVADMNVAFGNPKGNYDNPDIERLRKQCKNIFDEALEVMVALGLEPTIASNLRAHQDFFLKHSAHYTGEVNIREVRDGLCDVQVFAMGGQHFLGVDGDMDMEDVIEGVMTRFIKDEADKEATIALHAAKGVTDVYFEGEYPRTVMKSASDQPDAPKGKFLKSASYLNTSFRVPPGEFVLKFDDGYSVNADGNSCELKDGVRMTYGEAVVECCKYPYGYVTDIVRVS